MSIQIYWLVVAPAVLIGLSVVVWIGLRLTRDRRES